MKRKKKKKKKKSKLKLSSAEAFDAAHGGGIVSGSPGPRGNQVCYDMSRGIDEVTPVPKMSKKKYGLDKEHDSVELEELVPSKNGSSDPMYDQEEKRAREIEDLEAFAVKKTEKEKES